MNLLLDTHMLLWVAIWPNRLPRKAHALFSDAENTLFFSSASIWEVAIKKKRGRPDFDEDARMVRRHVLDGGARELPIASYHAVAVGDLPSIHKDPFDRILLAQAREEGFTLVTSDETLAKYPISVLYIPKRSAK
jgi:PIN domain nuclease of toxin-antitoxin system